MGPARAVVAAVVVIVALGAAVVCPLRTTAAGQDVGDVVVVDAADPSRPALDAGDGSTVFSLRLPDGAACPGDSANDQWRVQTFVIPATDDPGAVTYAGVGPAGPPEGVHNDNRWALYDIDSSPFTDELTQRNTSPGRPGLISVLPPFSFGPFGPEQLPPGRYAIGVACTSADRTTGTYWDARIDIDATPGADGIRWAVAPDVDASESGATSSGAPSDASATAWIVVGAIAVALAGALVAFRRRSTHVTNPRTKEQSA